MYPCTVSDIVGLSWSLRTCIFDEVPGDTGMRSAVTFLSSGELPVYSRDKVHQTKRDRAATPRIQHQFSSKSS